MNNFSLKEHFRTRNENGVTDPGSPYNILYETKRKDGDIAITKNLPTAHSIATHVIQASKDHYMVAVACPIRPSSADKPVAETIAAQPLPQNADKPAAEPIAKRRKYG